MRLIVFAVCLGFASSAYAQGSPTIDGNWWNSRERTAKNYILLGFIQGMELGKRFSQWQGVQGNKIQGWVVETNDFYLKYFDAYVAEKPMSQFVDGLDDLYKDFRNRSIDLPSALWVVMNQIAGKTQPEIDKLLEASRKGLRPPGC